MYILGIETSCDDTAVAIYNANNGLILHTKDTEVNYHNLYGGVVPELASRNHIAKLLPLIKNLLFKAKIDLNALDIIAYTKGPGLAGSLFIGSSVAKSLGFALNIPVVGINHLEAHLLSPFLEENHPSFPFISLIISGGHTLLVRAQNFGVYEILGETLDDACGEVIDKIARKLDLKFPGGVNLAKLAVKGKVRFNFPKPLCSGLNLNFSFSGLKTAVLNIYEKTDKKEQSKADIAASFQKTIIDILVYKTKLAIQYTKLNQIVVSGGVSANKVLRSRFTQELRSMGANVFFPRLEFCTDNGAMVAHCGLKQFKNNNIDKNISIKVLPKYSLEDIRLIHECE